MEDGVKENPTQHKEPKFLGKAGWVKKAGGRLLGSYKDRYVHVEKTEVVVYEHEDLQTCLERLDLENYHKCHELKSPFKKKHRLVLIRSPKSGNKVHDVKFQAQSAEEKEAWIRALSDAIGRAKNKVFDEVKVDEGCNLEHVTRTRPKGNRNRRPPTRIHMKEVADVSCDGILRLDLDLEDAIMPNGTHHTTIDGAGVCREGPMPQPSPEEKEEAQSELEVSPPKKVIKPPMLPFKEVTPPVAVKDGADQVEGPKKKVLKPPMPPSKEAKLCAPLLVEDATEPQTSPDARKKTAPPPTPPNKPSSFNLADASHPHPPRPPSKDKKPPYAIMQADAGDWKEEEDDGVRKATEDEEEAPPQVRDDGPEHPGAEWGVSEDQSEETVSCSVEAEPLRLLQPDMLHVEDSSGVTLPGKELDSAGSETSAGSPQMEMENSVSSVMVTLNDPLSDGLGLSSLLGHLPGEIKETAVEEKSVDSGQHSENDSEGLESEDTLAASTAALRGSHAGLDALDAREDGIQISVHLSPPRVTAKPQVRPKHPAPPLKPSTKVRSASIGDLLSDSAIPVQVRTRGSMAAPSDYVTKLETEVALEMEKTNKLLSRVSQSQKDDDGEGVPEDLLAKAMEKLKKAEHVLKEIRKLKPANSSSHRKSW